MNQRQRIRQTFSESASPLDNLTPYEENLRVAFVRGLDADLELMPLLECHVLDFLCREMTKRNMGKMEEWMDEFIMIILVQLKFGSDHQP